MSVQAPSSTRCRNIADRQAEQRAAAPAGGRGRRPSRRPSSTAAPVRLCSTRGCAERELDQREQAPEHHQPVVDRRAAEHRPDDEDRRPDEPEEHGARSANEEATALLAVHGRVGRELLDAVDLHGRQAQVAAAARAARRGGRWRCRRTAAAACRTRASSSGSTPAGDGRPARPAPARARRRSPTSSSAICARSAAARSSSSVRARAPTAPARRRAARSAPSARAPGPRAGEIAPLERPRSRPAAPAARGGCRSCRCRASCRAGSALSSSDGDLVLEPLLAARRARGAAPRPRPTAASSARELAPSPASSSARSGRCARRCTQLVDGRVVLLDGEEGVPAAHARPSWHVTAPSSAGPIVVGRRRGRRRGDRGRGRRVHRPAGSWSSS